MKADVVAIGELLIDFIPYGKSAKGNPVYEMNPGGAPANCLAALNALGVETAMIGKVGADNFGHFIVNEIKRLGINTSAIKITDETHTTLAYIHLGDEGEREFQFLRDPGADTLIKKDEIDFTLLDQAKAIHFGSISLTDEPARSTTLEVIKYAKSRKKLISYDPNYRALLWKSTDDAIKWMKTGLALADIVKMSEEEYLLVTGCTDLSRGLERIRDMGISRVFVTMGSKGAYFFSSKEGEGFVPSYSVNAVDTTGCGDAFMGAILYKMLHSPAETTESMVKFANACGALCATKFGGLPSMPNFQEIHKLVYDNDIV